MANTTVSPQMRARGWNIHLLAGTEHFAGLYHHPGSDTLRYRDMIDELRLCFELPPLASAPHPTDAWKGLAFGHLGVVNVDRWQPFPSHPSFVWGASLDLPVSAPGRERSINPKQPCFSRWQVVRHDDCDLPTAEPLETHIRGTYGFISALCNSWLINCHQQLAARRTSPSQISVRIVDTSLQTKGQRIQTLLNYHIAKPYGLEDHHHRSNVPP